MKITFVVAALVCGHPAWGQEEVAPEIVCSDVPGEVVVCFTSPDRTGDVNRVVERWDLRHADPDSPEVRGQMLLGWRRPRDPHFTNVALLQYDPNTGHQEMIGELTARGDVLWAAPNRVCTGDVRDAVPDDPSYETQYHHPLMQNDLAWDVTFGDASVIIAVTDDGIDLDHEDLVDNIWSNPGEIAGNGVDDDGNGYVDDVNGWDFINGGNNPNPDFPSDTHGTHVAGIAAARTNNGIGVAGTAGGATIMPIQFFEQFTANWTSAVIAQSFAYAADNGARIVVTSYNMDGWAITNDPTVFAAFTYLHDHGVLHFNSAGNGNTLNPPRQIFGQSLLVASTDSGDAKAGSSNFGMGIDLAAPGVNILSTVQGDNYSFLSGTSMAAPNAAGVAALIWSANPSWTRDRIAAQILATADDVDAINPAFAGLLGTGRVNSFRGVSEVVAPGPPRIVSASVQDGGSTLALDSIDIQFDQVMDSESVNDVDAIELEWSGPDHAFGGPDDLTFDLEWSYFVGGEGRVTLVPPRLPFGLYRLTIDASIVRNPFGDALDGDGNGIGGDSWRSTFVFGPDCNGNLMLDDFDISSGTSTDCNSNGIPDECMAEEGDCNANGVSDGLDICNGTSTDCNGDGEPDQCPFAGQWLVTPLDFDSPQVVTVHEPHRAADDVLIEMAAHGDFDQTNEFIQVSIDGDVLSPLFADPGNCPECPLDGNGALCDDSLIIPAALWNEHATDGMIELHFLPTFQVNSTCIEPDFGILTISHPILDCNGNGEPDVCDAESGIDCNGNGVPDECIALEIDCNNNGVPDECDIAAGTSQDCNLDGVPDECVPPPTLQISSGGHSPIQGGAPVSFTWQTPPAALGDVELRLLVHGDFDGLDESIDVRIDGVDVGAVLDILIAGGCTICPFDGGAAACGDSLMIDQAVWETARADGPITIELIPSPAVNAQCTVPSTVTIEVIYPVDNDCNGNGVPDACDVAAATSRDDNSNGVPDECECLADIDLDGMVGVTDLLAVLSNWGSPGPTDVNLDGMTNVFDLLLVLGGWGLCP